MKNQTRIAFVLLLAVAAWLISCKDDEKPKLIPEVTTTSVTDVTITTATGGGAITSDGNDTVTASGICWSSTNALPTTADSKTQLTTAAGSFTSKMENLTSGTTYRVRAYATNSIGIGYGEVITFTTGNAAPVAKNVAITGTAEVNKTLTGSYTYSDENSDAESGTTLQWYKANDASGTGEAAIVGATALIYTLQDIDEFKYIRFGVTPKAAIGTATGAEVKSSFVGPIAVRTTVTFTYNGAAVTYGIITSSVTGRKWLDRNLGAPNAPSAYDDFANHGDLFQWGRLADGHQLINRAATSDATVGVNGTTTNLSSSDVPGHGLFIITPTAFPRDWRDPQNDNLWQGVVGINNPCPSGWRIPTSDEWNAEQVMGGQAAYQSLKITPNAPGRLYNGAFSAYSYYWTSTLYMDAPIAVISYTFTFDYTNPYQQNVSVRGEGNVCRCIKN